MWICKVSSTRIRICIVFNKYIFDNIHLYKEEIFLRDAKQHKNCNNNNNYFLCRCTHENGLSIILSGCFRTVTYFYEH